MAHLPITRATDAAGDEVALPETPNVGQFGAHGDAVAATVDALRYSQEAAASASAAALFADAADEYQESAGVFSDAAQAAKDDAAASAESAAASEQNAAASAKTATTAAGQAIDVQKRWETMTAQASTVAAGEEAGAYWDASTGTMFLSIPRGMNGTVEDFGAAPAGTPDAGAAIVYVTPTGDVYKSKIADVAALLPKGIHQRGTVDASTGAVIDWEGLLTEWAPTAPPVQEGESPDGAMFVVTGQGKLQITEDGDPVEFYEGDRLYWQEAGGGWQIDYLPVTSVNGKTRAVKLAAADVGAFPATGGRIDDEVSLSRLVIPAGAGGACDVRFVDASGVSLGALSVAPGSISLRGDRRDTDGSLIAGKQITFDSNGGIFLPAGAKLRGATDKGAATDIISFETGDITAIGSTGALMEIRCAAVPAVVLGEDRGQIFTELNPPTAAQVKGAYSEENPPTNYAWKEIGDQNLNYVVESGYFFQGDYKLATPEHHYPEPHTGFLWVLRDAPNTTQIWVTQGTSNIYTRSFANATGWLEWRQLMTSEGGEFTSPITVPQRGLVLTSADDSEVSGFVTAEHGHVFLAQQLIDDGEQYRFIGLSSSGEPTYRAATPETEAGYTDYKIYHEGYQPPASNLKTILDAIYPVGICITFAENVDPNVIYKEYGHTWENLAEVCGNRAIVINSDPTGAGIGTALGADSHTLTVAEMPAHSHGIGTLAVAANGQHTHGGTATSAGAHAHLVPTWVSGGGNVPRGQRYVDRNSFNNAGQGTFDSPTSSAGAHTHPLSITAAGSHAHTLTGSTAAAGGGQAFSLWQPSVLLNVWKRMG